MISYDTTADLDIVQAAYDANELTWADVQATQRALAQRCTAHNRPSDIVWGGVSVCDVCVEIRAAVRV